MAKKYIDAELLLKEVESRIRDCDANSKNPNQLLWAELSALIPFINSLQQEEEWEGQRTWIEQPSEDLDEATARYGSGYCDTGLRRTAEFGFRSGAEWQRQRTPMPEDTVLFNNGVAEGRRLERQDMLKDAVEGKIYGYDDGSFELIVSWLDLPKDSKFKDGDRVKIVIVPDKEEEK